MDLPAGHAVGNPGQAGFPAMVCLGIVYVQSFRLRAHEEGPASRPLAGPVRQQRDRLARAGCRIGGRADAPRRRTVDVDSVHGPQQDIAAFRIFGETLDDGIPFEGNVHFPHRGCVHDRQAAGLSGQPDASGCILEYPVHERRGQLPVQDAAPPVFQGVGFRIQDVDPLLGSGHPEFGGRRTGPDFQDVGDILGGSGHFRIPEVDMAEGTVVGIECLQAHRRPYPQDAPAVLEDGGDKVAGQRVGPVAGEPEGGEVHPVKPGESAFRGDPDEPARILEDVFDLAAGQAGFGGIQPCHLGTGGKEEGQ